jgi:hypothetical protein
MKKTDDASHAIAKARSTMAAVDRRARKCASPLCRRNARCMANPSAEAHFHHRTGGCPLTTRTEWARIKAGLQASLTRTLDAVEAVQQVTGESSHSAQKRMLVCHPFKASDRRVLMDLWRREA